MISPSELRQANDIFAVLNWDRDGDLFERFCHMLDVLDEDQKKLVLDLTRRFLWIPYTRYVDELKNALKAISPEDVKPFDHIIVLPLSKPNQLHRIKSGSAVAYLFKGIELKLLPLFSDKELQVFDEIPSSGFLEKKNSLLLLVDDFIGTGDTAMAMLQKLVEERGIEKKRIQITSIVGQNTGVSRIEKYGVRVSCSVFRGRGISDEFKGGQLSQALKTMNEIENLLKVSSDYRLGYKGSEALVSLLRAPNNTFPVYWKCSRLENGVEYVPIFPR